MEVDEEVGGGDSGGVLVAGESSRRWAGRGISGFGALLLRASLRNINIVWGNAAGWIDFLSMQSFAFKASVRKLTVGLIYLIALLAMILTL